MNNCSFFGEINLFKLKNKKINFLYLFCKTNGFLIFLGPFRILEYWEYCASRISRISRMCQSMVVPIQLPCWRWPTHLCIHLVDLAWFVSYSPWHTYYVMQQHCNNDNWFDATSPTHGTNSTIELDERSATLMLWYHVKNGDSYRVEMCERGEIQNS